MIRAGVSSDAPTGSSPELKLISSLGIWQTRGDLKAWFSVIHSLWIMAKTSCPVRPSGRGAGRTLDSNCLKPAKRKGADGAITCQETEMFLEPESERQHLLIRAAT